MWGADASAFPLEIVQSLLFDILPAEPVRPGRLTSAVKLTLLLSAAATAGLTMYSTLTSTKSSTEPVTAAHALKRQGIYRPRSTLPLLGNTLDVLVFHKDRLHDCMAEQIRAAGGKPWELSIIGRSPIVVFTSPDACKDIFKAHFDAFERGPTLLDRSREFVSDGVAGLDREEWETQRRIVTRLMSAQDVSDAMDDVVIKTMGQLCSILTASARSGQPISVQIMLSTITKSSFGVDLKSFEDDPKSLANEDEDNVYRDHISLLPQFKSVTDSVVTHDTLKFIMMAGKNTMSNTMAWFVVMMNRHPHVLSKIRNEIRAKLPDLGKCIPTSEELSTLLYLEAAIKECVRLYMSIILRTPKRSTCVVDGTFVPFGTSVMVSAYAAARMASIWEPDAAEYRPERFIDEETGKLKVVSPFKFLGFLCGPQQCPGLRYAMLEMKTMMSTLMHQFDLKTVEDPLSITYRSSDHRSMSGSCFRSTAP